MKHLIGKNIFFLLLLASNIYAQEYSGNGADVMNILKVAKEFSKAYVDSDYDTLVSIYSDDAKILPPGTNIISSKNLIKEKWVLPKGVKVIYHEVIPKEITVIGDIAYDYGIYEGSSLNENNKRSMWKGKYVIIWKKVDDSWKIYLDIWNRIDIKK